MKVKKRQVGRSRKVRVIEKPMKKMVEHIKGHEFALQKERLGTRQLREELGEFGMPFSQTRTMRLGPSRLQPDFYEIAGFSDELRDGVDDEFSMEMFGLDGY